MTGNEVEIRVVARNATKPGFDAAKVDSAKAGEEMGHKLGDSAARALEQASSKLDTSFVKIGRSSGKSGGKAAGDEFIAGLPFGIGKGAIGIGKAITTLFDKLTPQVAKDALGLGEKAGKALADGIVSTADTAAQDVPALFTPEGAIGAGIIAALVGSLAPAAGAAIATAMTLGVGASVIGLGALIDKDSPAVVAGFTRLKNRIASTMRFAADPLVGPFAKALDTIDKWVGREGPNLRRIFADAAPGVQILTDGILHFVSTVEPGIHKLSQTFTQFLQDPQAKATWDQFASDVNAFFSTMGAHKQLIVDTFTALMSVLDAALGIMNGLVNTADALDKAYRKLTGPLMAIYEHYQRIDEKSHWMDAQQTTAGALGDQLAGLAVSYDDLAKSLSHVSVTADTLAGSLTDKILNGLMKSDLAVLHFDESLSHITESLKTNGKQLDIHTAKGQANREAVLASIQANIDQYDAMIQSGLSAKDAAGQYDVNTTALERQLKKAGLTKDAIDGLIGKYKHVPTKVNTAIAMEGLTKAITDLDETLRLINHLPSLKTITIVTRHIGTVAGGDVPSARASGGIASGLTWVGERGAELVRLPQGSTVYPHGQSMGMAGHGGGPMTVNVQMTFGGSTDTAMATAVQRMFRAGQIQLVAQVNGNGPARVHVG